MDQFYTLLFKKIAPTAALFLFVSIFSCQNTPIAPNHIEKKDSMVLIPAGILNMGGDNEQASPNELPKHQVKIGAFWMDETEVTNTQFQAFINATNYMTIAERDLDWEEMKKDVPPGTPKPPDSIFQAGSLVFKPTTHQVPLNNPNVWWEWTISANWKHPEGPDSNLEGKMNHPVVHIAWKDAVAYANWADKRLPTEAEWEWAARGGLENAIYTWGNDDIYEGVPMANFWQGPFPYINELEDGFLTTAPVKSYPPNAYDLYDMSGNVWEWCADWLDIDFYKNPAATQANTKGASSAYNPSMPFQKEKVVRGGSFLCSENYCAGYRNASRMGSSVDTGLSHTGFRCVRDFAE